ncbi:MAG: HupE/UreJ family protein [Candidatus Obscuribacterales bacterium]|nr:HupE/UreJ family protein [Steroidobacteraceae bacterium]
MTTTAFRVLLASAVTYFLYCVLAPPSLAHDLPGKVSLLVFVKPQDNQLLVLTRVPMEAFTEVQFPVQGPGYLDFSRADSALNDAAQMYITQGMHFFADGKAIAPGQVLKTRVALPSDKSFIDFNSALANINSPPLTNAEQLYWKQGSLDVLMSFPIASAHAQFAVDSNLERIAMQTHTVVRYLPVNGSERIYSFLGNPGRIELEPSWWYATYRFITLGFSHILDGADHLLFLFCLMIPSRSVRELVPVITSFTIAHSISLISSAVGLTPTASWFPALVETLIALSVFYMACENVLGARVKMRWLIVFGFGLIHGFGFSFILSDRMQFAGTHLVSALLAFNVGVELGQLLVLIVTVPVLRFFFKRFPSEKIGIILLSAIAAHSAWHWLTERGEQLLKYSWIWPTFDAAFFAAALRWVMLVLASAGILWAMIELFNRFSRTRSAPVPGAEQKSSA